MSFFTLKCAAKSFLVSLNTVFVLIGLGVIVLTAILLSGENMVGGYLGPLFAAVPSGSGGSVSSIFTTAVIIALCMGLFIVVISVLGCCAGTSHNKCIIISYAVIMIIILIGEITIVIMCSGTTNLVDSQIKTTLKDTITKDYEGTTSNNDISLAWNYAFVTFSCCGVDDYMDLQSASKWNRTTEQIPETCCKVTGSYPNYGNPTDATCVTTPTTDNSYYEKGCFQAIKDEIQKYSAIIIGISSGVMFLQLCAIISAFFVFRNLQVGPTKQRKS